MGSRRQHQGGRRRDRRRDGVDPAEGRHPPDPLPPRLRQESRLARRHGRARRGRRTSSRRWRTPSPTRPSEHSSAACCRATSRSTTRSRCCAGGSANRTSSASDSASPCPCWFASTTTPSTSPRTSCSAPPPSSCSGCPDVTPAHPRSAARHPPSPRRRHAACTRHAAADVDADATERALPRRPLAGRADPATATPSIRRRATSASAASSSTWPRSSRTSSTAALTEAFRPHGGWSRPQDRHHLDVDDRDRHAGPTSSGTSTGEPAAVIDAKYKAEKPAGFPDADLYQMLAYCTALGLPDGHLVYAKGNATEVTHEVRRVGVVIHAHTVDLDVSRRTARTDR